MMSKESRIKGLEKYSHLMFYVIECVMSANRFRWKLKTHIIALKELKI